MASLNHLATPDDVVSVEKDTLGGYTPLPSGLYKMKIELAFLKSAKSGAIGLNLHFNNADGKQLREVLWVVSGDAKGNRNWFPDKRTGEKHLLPGLQIANAVGFLSAGKLISEMDSEEKVISLYDSAVQAETPTKVDMITELLGKEVILGVKQNIVNKNVKNGAGVYVPSAETRNENIVDRIFSAVDGKTMSEEMDGSDAIFIESWEKKWKGVTTDKSVKVAASASVPGGAVSAPAAAVSTPTLFPGQE